MITVPILVLGLLVLACVASVRARAKPNIAENIDAFAARIDAVLPQTQCTRCGYPACKPYAEAIARGEAPINRCPPGGRAVIRALASLTGLPVQALDPAFGIESAMTVAMIDEDVCIGCTKCIQACPVDAIIGANKLMHTVIPQLCTGCELCIPPCPVDCIAMLPAHNRRQPIRPMLPYAA